MRINQGYQALRRGRVSIPGQIYLVTFVTRKRRPIFNEFGLARVAAQALSSRQFWLGSEVLCWVLMPDHWHGLIQLQGDESLSRCVNRAKAASSWRLNKAMARKGPLWQEGFHDRAIRHDESLKALAKYVVANPLRAGLAKEIGQYPFWDAVWL